MLFRSTWTVTVIGLALAGTDAANYTAGDSDTTSATIARKSITLEVAVADKTYDATTGATITGCDVVGEIPTTDVSCDFSSATAAFSDASAGTWTVTVIGLALAGTDAANYTAGDSDTTSATIARRSVTGAIAPRSEEHTSELQSH